MSLIYINSFIPGGIVKDGLVLHLDAAQPSSYPGSGTTWTDLSGNGNNGTLVNGVGYTADNGGSLSFDGTDDYSQVTGSITASQATLISWIRRNGSQGQYDGILFSRSTNVTGMNFQTNNQLGYTWNDAFNTYNWNSGLTIPDLTWCMCAISVSGSSAIAYLCQSSGITSSTNNVNHATTTIDSINIGRDSYNLAPPPRYFTGNISQVSIYNKALTAAEITQNFNALKSRYGL